MAEKSVFAELFRGLRARASLTQGALAERSGLSVSAIRHYEYGLREPSYSALVQLARGLGVGLSAFEGGGPAAAPDLARVNSAWPGLPQHIRSSILALVDAGIPGKAPGVPQDAGAGGGDPRAGRGPEEAPAGKPSGKKRGK
jgi:transcriptional regulator with XRE-family HTH domain